MNKVSPGAGRALSESLRVIGVAHGGYGVTRVDGRTCFVPYALPGDVVRVRIERHARGVLWGSIEETIEASPDRCDAPCPVFGQCGGCSWLHFRYPAQGEWKRRIVSECLRRIGGVDAVPDWMEEPNLRLGYRTRAEFHCDGTHWGFYARTSRRVVDIENCPLCHPVLNAAFATLRRLRAKGSVEITANPEGAETMIWLNRRSRSVRLLLPEADQSGASAPRKMFFFDGAPIVNGAFTQPSLLLNRMLVRVVRDIAGMPSSLLDLYCGNGNLSRGYACDVPVLGLDHNAHAIRAAASAGVGEYRVAQEERFTDAIRERAWDVILLDPPRTGARLLMPSLAACGARSIVYVSCDPATLARDAKVLFAGRWRLARITVVDMFPNTHHIETVCRFER